ncbi:bZIP transcription factor [Colletotrichum paranaense]|uniref:BZIP transcription factor n=1 Tax=Colletotrichum paranaense TaxID=1914294 RepID=A0ABQ9SDE6_9PEZI|nr:bZIP transcription factor [Colletotrichum paranaense]KAK1533511.1 bZIP transcription factor [Colletotrichum paranaense]
MSSDRDADLASRTIGAPTPDLRLCSAAPDLADVFEEVLPTERTSGPKRRSGRPRLSNSDSSPNPLRAAETNPIKVRTQNVRRRPSYTSASDDSNKQDSIRARNRQAAHRCRKKKQKVDEDLQTQEIAINNINKHLQCEAANLQSEILCLKNMVLQHSGCACRSIDEYIAQAAQNLVQGALATMPSLLSEAAPPVEADVQASGISWQDVIEGRCYVGWDMLDRPTCLYSALEAQSSV